MDFTTVHLVNYQEASQLAAKGYETALQMDEIITDSFAIGQIAHVSIANKEWIKAAEELKKAINPLRDIQQPDETAHVAARLAIPLLEMGEFEEAQKLITESIGIVLFTRSFKVTLVLAASAYWFLKKKNLETAVFTYSVAKNTHSSQIPDGLQTL